MLPTKCQYIWPSGSRGEDLKRSANQKQELPVAPMFAISNLITSLSSLVVIHVGKQL
jgi:hypothetical protein